MSRRKSLDYRLVLVGVAAYSTTSTVLSIALVITARDVCVVFFNQPGNNDSDLRVIAPESSVNYSKTLTITMSFISILSSNTKQIIHRYG